MKELGLTQWLLVVEDSDEDFEATRRVFKQIGMGVQVTRSPDGDDALDRLLGQGAYSGQAYAALPSLILLDLNLPATDGREVLAVIKQNEQLKSIPVIVLTTSANPKDVDTCYRVGANSYVIKPVNFPEFIQKIQRLCEYWFGTTILPEVQRK